MPKIAVPQSVSVVVHHRAPVVFVQLLAKKPSATNPAMPANTHPRPSASSDEELVVTGGVDVLLSGHYADRVMRIITERLSSGGFR